MYLATCASQSVSVGFPLVSLCFFFLPSLDLLLHISDRLETDGYDSDLVLHEMVECWRRNKSRLYCGCSPRLYSTLVLDTLLKHLIPHPDVPKSIKNIESIPKMFLKHTIFRISTYVVLHKWYFYEINMYDVPPWVPRTYLEPMINVHIFCIGDQILQFRFRYT